MTTEQHVSRRFAMARILGMPMLALVILLAVGAGFKPAPVAPGFMPAQAAAVAAEAADATDAAAAPATAPEGV